MVQLVVEPDALELPDEATRCGARAGRRDHQRAAPTELTKNFGTQERLPCTGLLVLQESRTSSISPCAQVLESSTPRTSLFVFCVVQYICVPSQNAKTSGDRPPLGRLPRLTSRQESETLHHLPETHFVNPGGTRVGLLRSQWTVTQLNAPPDRSDEKVSSPA